MYFGAETGRQKVFYVAFPDVAHSSSSRSGAQLENVVWSKVWNAEGENGKRNVPPAYAAKSSFVGDSLLPGSILRSRRRDRGILHLMQIL
jgi:hypothetical protein